MIIGQQFLGASNIPNGNSLSISIFTNGSIIYTQTPAYAKTNSSDVVGIHYFRNGNYTLIFANGTQTRFLYNRNITSA